MNIDNTSICIECGKVRIVVGTHSEVVGNTTVTYKETSCPDADCQKKVEKLLAVEQVKRQESASNRQRRIVRGRPRAV